MTDCDKLYVLLRMRINNGIEKCYSTVPIWYSEKALAKDIPGLLSGGMYFSGDYPKWIPLTGVSPKGRSTLRIELQKRLHLGSL